MIAQSGGQADRAVRLLRRASTVGLPLYGAGAQAGSLIMSTPFFASEVPTFATQLRLFRLRAGLTQEVLAERAGVSSATIAALEQGLRRRPYPHTLAALAHALQLGPADQATLLARANRLVGRTQELGSAIAPARAAGPELHARLPVPPTVLVGREDEVVAATALLQTPDPATRLLTLVGPGGVGKTRMALAVAAALANTYSDGVVFVDLAPLRDHRLLPVAIARALGLRESGGRSARQRVFEYLRGRRLLLVLDNFEHVMSGVVLVAELLESCPRTVLIVTSRTALRLRAERRFAIGPLAVPTGADAKDYDVIAASPAVSLFVERAQAAAPNFGLTAANATAVAAVCRRVDGMPLAIELAASRVRLLPPATLLRRLERRLSLLADGAADLPERQQTLRNTIAWSYHLLDPHAQALFRQLAVFVGGCTLEAIESVCCGDDPAAQDVLEVVGALIDNSLVCGVDCGDDKVRFEMLETIREYGLEQLEACRETEGARRRHFDWYLSLAERVAPERFERAHPAILKQEEDNLRAALNWASEHREVALGLRLAGALAGFWWVSGYPREGSAWLHPLLALAEGAEVPAAVRANALHGAAVLANAQGEYARSKVQLKQSVALFRESGDVLGHARAIASLGGTAYDEGDLDGAIGLWTESLALAREAGDPGEVAESLGCIGEATYHLGDLEGAAQRLEEASAIARQAGRTDIEAWQIGALANVARRQGDLARATTLQRRALAMETALVDRRQIAISLEHLAQMDASAGGGERAARLLGSATALRELIGAPQPAPDRSDTEQAVAGARAALGEPLWATAFQAGRSLSLEQAIAEGLEEVV